MQLLSIFEQKFQIEQVLVPNENYQVNWDIFLDFTVPQDRRLLEVRANVVAYNLLDSDRKQMMAITVGHHFKVENIDQLIYSEDNQEFTDQARLLLASLIGICLSGIRGMIFTRATRMFGDNFFLPLVNPLDFTKSMKPFVTADDSVAASAVRGWWGWL